MFSLTILRRLAAVAVVAGAATAATAASANGISVDDLLKITTPNGAPNYNNPNGNPDRGYRRQGPRRMSAAQFFSGDWIYRAAQGGQIAFRFKKNGHVFIRTSANPGVVQAGTWKFRGSHIVLTLVIYCRSKQQGGCRRFAQPRTVKIAIRIVNKDRIMARGGYMTRRTPI
jgi:hypothetical protein